MESMGEFIIFFLSRSLFFFFRMHVHTVLLYIPEYSFCHTCLSLGIFLILWVEQKLVDIFKAQVLLLTAVLLLLCVILEIWEIGRLLRARSIKLKNWISLRLFVSLFSLIMFFSSYLDRILSLEEQSSFMSFETIALVLQEMRYQEYNTLFIWLCFVVLGRSLSSVCDWNRKTIVKSSCSSYYFSLFFLTTKKERIWN